MADAQLRPWTVCKLTRKISCSLNRHTQLIGSVLQVFSTVLPPQADGSVDHLGVLTARWKNTSRKRARPDTDRPNREVFSALACGWGKLTFFWAAVGSFARTVSN